MTVTYADYLKDSNGFDDSSSTKYMQDVITFMKRAVDFDFEARIDQNKKEIEFVFEDEFFDEFTLNMPNANDYAQQQT